MLTDFALDERLQKALAELSFETATEVQAQTIPLALAAKDLLVSSETGSGKTLAFLLPIFQRLLEQEVAQEPAIGALVLAPTRELARQILRQAKRLAAHTPLKASLVMGGEDFKYQQLMLERKPDILVATPGRLMEHVANDSVDLSALKVLVMDEADRMLDMGFKEAVEDIIQLCPPSLNDAGETQRQTLLFSATLEHRGLGSIRKSILHDAERVIIGEVRRSYSHIKQQIVLADDWKHKEKLLAKILTEDTYKKAVVFTNRRLKTAELRNYLRYCKLQAGALHGEMDGLERKRVTDDLRFSRIKILVATDVAARGLDVPDIDLVINFDVPRKGDDYVHRIGRTGRAGETGTAISFVNSDEWNNMGSIERYLSLKLERRVIKELKANYNGPVKTKKAELARKEKESLIGKRIETKKKRHRDTKNKGKRRSPKA